MAILSWILGGLFIGALARLAVPGPQRVGLIWTIVLGIAGAILGGLFVTEVLDRGRLGEASAESFIASVAAAAILLAVLVRFERAIPDRRRGDGRPFER